MFRWCAFCQNFLGEKEPFEDYSISHTICPSCNGKKSRFSEPDALASIQMLADVHRKLMVAGKKGDLEAAKAALEEAVQLKFPPIDLLLGILQPSLYEIGEKWASSKVTIAEEHRFTSLASGLIPIMGSLYPDVSRLRQNSRPELLLMCAEGNAHNLGLQVVELFLLLNGVSTFVHIEALSAADAVSLTRALQPSVVAFSVALHSQMEAVFHFAKELKRSGDEPQPTVAVGGFAVRKPCDKGLYGVVICPAVFDLLALCREKAIQP